MNNRPVQSRRSSPASAVQSLDRPGTETPGCLKHHEKWEVGWGGVRSQFSNHQHLYIDIIFLNTSLKRSFDGESDKVG